jgi:hypothetical protein
MKLVRFHVASKSVGTTIIVDMLNYDLSTKSLLACGLMKHHAFSTSPRSSVSAKGLG